MQTHFHMRAEKAVNNFYMRYLKVYRVKFVQTDTLLLAVQPASTALSSLSAIISRRSNTQSHNNRVSGLLGHRLEQQPADRLDVFRLMQRPAPTLLRSSTCNLSLQQHRPAAHSSTELGLQSSPLVL